MNTKQTSLDAYLVLFFGQFFRWPFCLFFGIEAGCKPSQHRL